MSLERPSRCKQFDTGSLNHRPRPLACTTLLWWLGCKWKIQPEFPLQNGNLIYRTYLPLHFFTELHLHTTKEGKCSLDALQFKVPQKICPSRSNAAFPASHRSLTSPTFVLAEKEGTRFFTGNVETGKYCFFLSVSDKGFLYPIFKAEHYYFTENWEFCKYFPSDVASGYLCT